ncbi:response regulator [Cohnella ginsengisoli]|uniref:Response regulator n=1 Tax=Cohnella ginsengisoli TaxID=425004 RepID=A0A9X4KMT8_9BACL|nr:response regulator [Cohnella ginsengisoli]MDG0792450.1 response regulator [Cohnella ginsengisoli]
MVTMLVVDDEIYALKGITQGIEWGDLPIARILEADSVPEARRQLEAHQVDLVISDIEMPGASGMELLRYIREARPSTLTIFLTGHARFEYAQEAMRHGCFEYVLKPVDHDALKEIVRRAVAEIEERRAQLAFEETLDTYRRQWASQLPILVERFWQEALAGGLPASPERLAREYATYDIPLAAGDKVLPVLLSVEQWDMALDGRDERIMEYALRKAAAEIIVGPEGAGAALQDRAQQSLVLLYGACGERERTALMARCRDYIAACREYFHCAVSCYVGEPAAPQALAGELERLSRLERANVMQPESVVDAAIGAEHGGSGAFAGSASAGQTMPPFMEWGILLEGGGVAELETAIADTLRRMKDEGGGTRGSGAILLRLRSLAVSIRAAARRAGRRAALAAGAGRRPLGAYAGRHGGMGAAAARQDACGAAGPAAGRVRRHRQDSELRSGSPERRARPRRDREGRLPQSGVSLAPVPQGDGHVAHRLYRPGEDRARQKAAHRHERQDQQHRRRARLYALFLFRQAVQESDGRDAAGLPEEAPVDLDAKIKAAGREEASGGLILRAGAVLRHQRAASGFAGCGQAAVHHRAERAQLQRRSTNAAARSRRSLRRQPAVHRPDRDHPVA